METIRDTLGSNILKADQGEKGVSEEKISAPELAEVESEMQENRNSEPDDDILDEKTMESISKMF